MFYVAFAGDASVNLGVARFGVGDSSVKARRSAGAGAGSAYSSKQNPMMLVHTGTHTDIHTPSARLKIDVRMVRADEQRLAALLDVGWRMLVIFALDLMMRDSVLPAFRDAMAQARQEDLIREVRVTFLETRVSLPMQVVMHIMTS